MITGSQVPVLLACPESFGLERVNYSTEASEKGSADHLKLEARVHAGTIVMPRRIPASAWKTESALGVDMSSGQAFLLGKVTNRDYSPGPFEIPGTVDAYAIEETESGRHGHVLDWKTGHSEIEPPEKNGQLMFYALALARAFKLDSVLIHIGKTKGADAEICQPFYQSAEVDVLDLDVFYVRLKSAYDVATRAALKKSAKSLNMGKHCMSCKAVGCPIQKQIIVRAKEGAKLTVNGVTPREAIDGIQAEIALAGKYQNMLRAMLASVVASGPVDVGDGFEFGEYEVEGSSRVDSKLGGQVMIRHFAPNHLEVNASIAAVDRAVKDAGLSGKEAAEKKAVVIADLRTVGAIAPTTKKVIEYRPKGNQLENKEEDAA